MYNKDLEKAFNSIDSLKNSVTNLNKSDYLLTHLLNAPEWLVNTFKLVDLKKDNIFIRENTKVEYIHVLIDGIVKAVDYRVFGVTYDYMWLHAVNPFGVMEVLLETYLYKSTLITVTPCKMLVVPRKEFEKWLKSDVDALAYESKYMVGHLLDQARRERIFLFMQGTDRVIYLLMQLYTESKDDLCEISIKRQELSDYSGLSIKTINRSINKLTEDGFIGRNGNKIIISSTQYKKMQSFISEKIEN